MNCYNPIWLDSQKIFVPCGSCFACRQAKSSEWTTRLLLELTSWPSSGFLTLTYDDDHLPWSLEPSHLTKFFKRLRKYKKVKYFACGEYGDLSKRPHYHAIVFGLRPDFVDRILVDKLWKQGRTSVDYVNKDTINYVTGYVMKKYSKEINKHEYDEKHLKVPFQRCSRGIGLSYALAHGEELSRQLSVRLYTGREAPLPRYFVNKLGIDTQRLKDKAKDSMVKYVSGIFHQANIKCNSLERLGFMLFHSKQWDKVDILSNAFQKINEQISYNWRTRVGLQKNNQL